MPVENSFFRRYHSPLRDFSPAGFVYGTVLRPACPVQGGGNTPQKGEQNMTCNQKQSIKEIRGSGLGYKKIALALDLPVGTVKSVCRRENITAEELTVYDENRCRQWADRCRLF